MFQDQWIGDSDYSKGPGNFGLYSWCTDRLDAISGLRIQNLPSCYDMEVEPLAVLKTDRILGSKRWEKTNQIPLGLRKL